MAKLEKDLILRNKGSLYISVFNVHTKRQKNVNKTFKIVYGKKRFNKIKEIIKKHNGLMGIFQEKPTSDLVLYALMLGVK